MPERSAGKDNLEKGEVTFRCGGRTYELRYDYNAIALVEQNSSKDVEGITEIANKLQNQQVSVNFMRALLYGGLQGGGHNLTLEEVGNLMDTLHEDERLPDILKRAGTAFSFAVTQDEEAKQEMKRRIDEREKEERPTETP